MKYRLIALDVDGTLLNDEHQLTATTKDTVRKVYHQGATIVLCTGRGPANAIPVMEQLGLEGVLITHNGAATVNSINRTVVHEYPLSMMELLPFIQYCRDKDIHFDVCTAFHLYIERLKQLAQDMYHKFMLEPVRLEDMTAFQDSVVKFTVFGDQEVIDQVEKDWSSSLFPHASLSMIRSGDQFIDIMRTGVSKGSALRYVAQSLGVERDQLLAIGNYFNDTDMLEFAGLGIAMDNSPDEVKQKADAVCPSNNEDGVHQALLQYCLS